MNYSLRYCDLKLRVSKNLVLRKMRSKFHILFFRDWNHRNQYAIYDFTVKEHCIAMNDKSDKTLEGVEMIMEMVFSMEATIGMVSEMSDDVMRSDLYRFSYNIEIWGIFYWILCAFIRFYFIHFSRLNSISIILFWENNRSASENYQVFEI